MFFSPSPAVPSFFRPLVMIASLALVACGGASSESEGPKSTADGAKKAQISEHGARPGDMVMGSDDAPVTVIEYASVTCSHCATFHETIFPAIKEKYVDTGKVKFVFREFPTPPVEFSFIGSVLARCAADKGGSEAYFLVINSLFKTQRTWIYADDPKLELLKIASQAGMDEAAFDTCLKRQDLVDQINESAREATEKYNVRATPNFVIEGERTPIGSIEEFETALDAALAKKES